MFYLFLSLLLVVCLFLIFRAFPLFNITTFQAIVVNYATCTLLGIIMLPDIKSLKLLVPDEPWVMLSFSTGLLFIFTFNLIAVTVQKVNVTVATIANKMSLIIPVSFSILMVDMGTKNFSVLNYCGIVLGMVAIILTSYQKKEVEGNDKLNLQKLLLPLAVFVFGGLIDLTINYLNYRYLNNETSLLFPIAAFFAASSAGLIIILVRWNKTNVPSVTRNIIGGIVLGIPNYFSIYFLLKALTEFNNNGAIVWPVLNIGIIVMASLLAYLIFKDKLTKLNIIGILFSVISIYLIFLE